MLQRAGGEALAPLQRERVRLESQQRREHCGAKGLCDRYRNERAKRGQVLPQHVLDGAAVEASDAVLQQRAQEHNAANRSELPHMRPHADRRVECLEDARPLWPAARQRLAGAREALAHQRRVQARRRR